MPLTTGETILNGKYRIVELLGKGAFAHVYRARHERLQRDVAIKTLRHGEEGVGSTRLSAYRDRFQLEAELGAQFDDPHLIRVYDFEEEDGALYLVMEYCPGGSLRKRLEEGSVPIDDAVRMAREVAEGLALLHGHRPQIVHRDLKPSNILLSADGVWKVADLGLAQVPRRTSRRSVLESAADWHPGTPEYMSPEQEEMKGYLQPPSDVWALGAVLFEALTGEMYKAVRPGTRARQLRPEVPAWLDELVARSVAEERKARPWDGMAFAEALARADTGPVRPEPEPETKGPPVPPPGIGPVGPEPGPEPEILPVPPPGIGPVEPEPEPKPERLPTGDTVEYASFGSRVVAMLIDSTVLTVMYVVLGVATGGLFLLVAPFVGIAYFVALTTGSGQTLGKRAMKIKVTKHDGAPVTIGTSLLRCVVGYTVSSLIIVGYLWPIWDKEKQALHDKIADTIVIKV